MVTLPAAEIFLRSRNAAASLTSRTSSASYTSGIAAALRAAFWKIGDSEWLSGFPRRTSRPGCSITGFRSAREPVEKLCQLVFQRIGGAPILLEVAAVGVADSPIGGTGSILV